MAPPSPSVSPQPTSNSGSTHSIALDPIAETFPPSPYASTTTLPSPMPESAFEGQRQHGRLFPRHLGLGHPPYPYTNPPTPTTPSTHSLPAPPRSATFPLNPRPNQTASSNVLILYSYAQLTGSLTLSLPAPALRERLLQCGGGIGGGSMDISASLSSTPSAYSGRPRGHKHARSSSLSSSILSLLTPSLSMPAITSPSSALSSSLAPGQFKGRAPSGPGWSGGREQDYDLEVPLPVFEVQSAMLAVDLELGPGEERTCTKAFPLIYAQPHL